MRLSLERTVSYIDLVWRGRIIVCLLLFSAWPAWAQNEDAARRLYALGEGAKAEKKYKIAANFYRAGYFELRKVGFLHNVATMYRKAGSCSEALYFYEKHVALDPKKQHSNSVRDLSQQCRGREDSLSAQQHLRSAWASESEYKCKEALESYRSYLVKAKNDQRITFATEAVELLNAQCGEEKNMPSEPVQESPETRKLLRRCETLLDHGSCDATACFKKYLGRDDAKNRKYARTSMMDSKNACGETKASSKSDLEFQLIANLGAGILSMNPVETPGVFSPSVALNVYLSRDWYLGANGRVVPLKYSFQNEGNTSLLTSLLLGGGRRIDIINELMVRAELNVGVLFWSGLDKANPFTESNNPTSGTLAMISLGGSVAMDWMINDRLFVTLTPLRYSFSPAKDGLLPKSIHYIDFLVGAGINW